MKSQKERSAEHYKKRIENGLCPRCGKKLDREGFYCTECLEKVRIYHRENKDFFRKNGLCPVCGKEKLIGDEKQCIICREKHYMRRKKPTEEQIKKRNAYFRDHGKKIYRERAEAGICTRCGKRKALEGRKKCGICLEKEAYNKMKKRFDTKSIREERKKNHLCYFCGKPVVRENEIVCQKCWQNFHDKRVQNKEKYANAKETWRRDNQLIFKS